MRYLGRYLSRLLGRSLTRAFNALPTCVRDVAVAYFPNLNNIVDTNVVEDRIGVRTDTVYYGQYLDPTSGQIDFKRTSGTFDYTDPSDGSLVEGVSMPANGLYTVPANGICEIGIYPKEDYYSGLMNFDGIDDYVDLGGISIADDFTFTFNMKFSDSNDTNYILINHPSGAFVGLGVVLIRNGASAYIHVNNDIDTINTKTIFDVSAYIGSVISIEITFALESLSTLKVNTNTISSSGADSSVVFTDNRTSYIGYSGSTYGEGHLIWNVNYNDVNAWDGQPNGNQNSAWVDTIGSNDGTVYGSPTTTSMGGIMGTEYSSFYPCCERAGTVLHDVMENSTHISIDSPVWSESLYGSDHLNQYGFTTKTDYDNASLTFESTVDGTPITLNDNTLIPAALWTYVPFQDVNGEIVYDINDEIIEVKENL